MLDFGVPSDSYYCFYVGSFLTLLLAIGNIAIWEGAMTPALLRSAPAYNEARGISSNSFISLNAVVG